VILTSDAGVKFLMLSATCPTLLRADVASQLGITNCLTIHAATDRPEISYNVILHNTLDEAKESLLRILKKQLDRKKGDASFRALVYCRSKDNVDELALKIGCKPFHADRPEDERAQTFKDWVEGKDKSVVASSLLGCGIHVPGVTAVFHLETPWSVLDFAQESGRGGRDGKPSMSFVFASRDEREPDGEDLYGKKTMRTWVLQNSVCRRTALSAFLDEGRTTCVSLPKAILCDVCRAESKKPHPGRLVKSLVPSIPDGDIPRLKKPLRVPPTSSSYERDRKRSRELQE